MPATLLVVLVLECAAVGFDVSGFLAIVADSVIP
jgi:hypothetical protein